jgi:2-oxo-hept-3-ene-1,7-dioate hydratase
MPVEDGYAIQRERVKLELAEGRGIRGRMIGLNSRSMQQASKITESGNAPLTDDMLFETGSDIPIGQFDRVTKAPRKVFDTITDLAANAGVVLGGTFTRLTVAAHGDVLHAEYGSAGHYILSVHLISAA